MPDQKNDYIPLIPAPLYHWAPATHADSGDQVLLMQFPRKIDATWCRQLSRIQRAIAPMGVSSLLPPHGFDFSADPACCAIPAMDLQPVDPAMLGRIFTADEIDRLVLTIASAISRIHLDDLLLGTISPANLLLKSIPAPETAVLTALTDAIDLKSPLSGRQYSLRSEYAAPELLEYIYEISDSSAACMTTACDVFSLGMLYHELLTGSLPAVRRAGSCPVPLDEPQVSKALDYPHRQLLRQMLRLNPEKRLQSMSAVIREINRLLVSGDCHVDLRCPELAGQTVLLRTGEVNCSRAIFSEQGEASFGPLLSDQTYTLFCNRNRLGVISFPDASSGQHLQLDYDQLSESLLAAPPAAAVPSEEELADVPMDVPEVVPAASPEPAPAALPEAAPADPDASSGPVPPAGPDGESAPLTQLMALLEAQLAAGRFPADAQQEVPPDAQVSDAEAPQEAPPDAQVSGAEAPQEEALPATPPEEEEAPADHDRTHSAVVRNEVIMPNPPLNNIRVIELLPRGYCRLTLINGGSFRIRTADAHRYGIAHLVSEE